MREWKIAQIYEIFNYTFAVGVAWDDPHVLGVFAGEKSTKLSLINETSYKEESEIDYFASVTFPSIACAYISQHKISPSEKALYKTLQSLEI